MAGPYPFNDVILYDDATAALANPGAEVVIFAPGDESRFPLDIRDLSGIPIPNPYVLGESRMSLRFIHETLDEVAWGAGEYSGILTSYQGIRADAAEARDAATAIVAEFEAGNLKGDTGPSAYDLAVAAGFTGTVDAWRESLKGDPGSKGDTGLPGVNAVANDTATAAQINSAASATRAALKAGFVEIRVPKPTQNPDIDGPAIMAAHNALPSIGGKLVLQEGTYAINSDVLVFTKPVWLTGAGGVQDAEHTVATTQIQCLTTNGVAIRAGWLRTDGFLLRNPFRTVAPTSGAGIVAIGSGLVLEADVSNFHTNVAVQGLHLKLGGSNYAPWYVGYDIGNDASPDSGDQILTGWVTAHHRDAHAAVLYRSGGGLKVSNFKINAHGGGGAVGRFLYGFDIALEATTSDLLISSSVSIENTRSYAVNMAQKGAATAQFQNISIYAQIAPYLAGVGAIRIAPANGTTPFSNIDLNPICRGSGGAAAIVLSNVNRVNATGVFENYTKAIDVSSTCRNVKVPTEERVWIPAAQLAASDVFSGGTITRTTRKRWDALQLSPAGMTILTGTIPAPNWNQYALDVYWVNAGAGTGGVRLSFAQEQMAAGATITEAGVSVATQTAIAAAQDVIKVTNLWSGVNVTAGSLISARIVRDGSHAEDTLPDAIAVLGVMIRRVN